MNIYLLMLCTFIFVGCSASKEDILSSMATEQKQSYFDTRERLKLEAQDDFATELIQGVEDSASLNMVAEDLNIESSQVLIPSKSAVWVIYPYEDRFGVKHNMTDVHIKISESQWYSDHGESLNYEGVDSGGGAYSPFFHVKGLSK